MKDKISVSVSSGAFFLLAALFMLLPLPWAAAVILSAGFHELCHIAAIYLAGGKVRRLTVTAGGAKMDFTPLPCSRELLCAAAGPCGSLLLIFLCRRFPRLAICGVFHGLYNLLPLFPLDGGRVLRCGASMLFPPKIASKIVSLTEKCMIAFLLLLCFYAVIRLGLGFLPILAAVLLWRRRKIGKFSCKASEPRVQ